MLGKTSSANTDLPPSSGVTTISKFISVGKSAMIHLLLGIELISITGHTLR
jgi:hypothetical protein